MKKNCVKCGKEFAKRPCESSAYWNTKRFCSYVCYWNNKQGKMPSHLKPFPKGEHTSPATEFKKGQTSLRKGKKQPQTKEQYEKRVAAMVRGKNHWNWQGGITSEHEKVRKSLEYKQWHKTVMERDRFQCQLCGYKGRELEVDHIKAFYLHPDLRLEVSNGRTLCKECHRKTATWGRKVYLLERAVVGANI